MSSFYSTFSVSTVYIVLVIAGDNDVVGKTVAGKLALTLPNTQHPTKTVHIEAIQCEYIQSMRNIKTTMI